jgi:hypothetical protein
MWFLHRKRILTKDKLIKRIWTVNEICCFYDNKESIKHIFFECPFAKIVWCIIYMTFGLALPKNTTNLFRNWLIIKAIGNNKERKRNHSTETHDFNVENPLQQREVKTTGASQQNFTISGVFTKRRG